MDYINISQAAERWGITPRRVQELCKNGAVNGATRLGRAWAIPADAERPIDGRTKEGKKVEFCGGKWLFSTCSETKSFSYAHRFI